MDKVKKWYQSIPLWLALFAIMTAALLLASVGSRQTTEAASQKVNAIQNKYMTGAYSPQDKDSDDDNVLYSINIDYHFEDYTDTDMRQYQLYSFVEKSASFFWYSICILCAGLLFYFTKLKKPLKILNNASARIANRELDFSLDYLGRDEMAKLCEAFETMREALDQNNREMLHMIDERKQLNDAYTHDLRTPIAVLKGYTDMLVKYIPTGELPPDEVLDTIKTMSTHVSRLEQFVDSMNTVQKLSDLCISREKVDAGDFLNHLQESAKMLCAGQQLISVFETDIPGAALFIDPSAVIQVYENLLGNATRFARSKVTIRCTVDENSFILTVQDDGCGFSPKDLVKAGAPYYSGQNEQTEYHFGLGLHICRTLCEKHGGKLEIANAPEGGAIISALFSREE